MSFPYRKILLLGATSGIGEALAHRFVKQGSFVIAVGRRKDRLDSLALRYGPEKVQAVPFDVAEVKSIPAFAKRVYTEHEDLDCVFMNAGIQRKADFSDPDSIDMDVISLEFTINYLSCLAMTKAFLPFFQSKSTETSLVYVTSALALTPAPARANYCASKAALHHFILCLREQLTQSRIKVIELMPPAVQTELHDAKHQPDIKDGGRIGMPLAEFTDLAYEELAAGKEQIPIGMAKVPWESFELKRQEGFANLVKMMRAQQGS